MIPVAQVTIHRLPDNVLLDVFDFYRVDHAVRLQSIDYPFSSPPWRWKTLSQVCRRWRDILFGSPRRLDLRLVITVTTPARPGTLLDCLAIWPSLPLAVLSRTLLIQIDPQDRENIIAAVQHRDRISEIFIADINSTVLQDLVSALSEPVPALTHFYLRSSRLSESVQGLPEAFLGGSAPLLKSFTLRGIPFPTFPQFILSATRIVELGLFNIPNSGYLSPEVLATSLATLPNLKSLSIRTQFDESHPLPTSPPASTRVVLPALSYLHTDGVGVYSEDFVARIDTPLLNELYVVFFMDDSFGHTPEFHNFICRTQMFRPFNQATMEFGTRKITVVLGYLESRTALKLKIIFEVQSWEFEDWEISPMVQILSQQLPLVSHVEDLKIKISEIFWVTRVEHDSSEWLQLLHLFIAVRSLYVCKGSMSLVGPALQELVGARTMEVLPALRNLSLDGLQPSGPLPEGIQSFVAARQVAGHPVEILVWVPYQDIE